METLINIFRIPELRKRILFTLSMLAVYRIGVFITLPGVDREKMADYMGSPQGGGFLGLFNMFSGGAIEQLSVFALGIMPYISASIIFQLLTVVVPTLDRLNKEGEQGRKKINQWTRYATIGLAIVQGLFIAFFLESINEGGAGQVVREPGSFGFRFMTVLTLAAGTAFIMWLGEQITERGIGNGMSLIIFAGIVAGLPDAIMQTIQMFKSEQIQLFTLLALLGVVLAVIMFIVFIERGQRRIPIQYAKRLVGNRVGAAQSTHLPLRVNMAGVIPPIFASSILMFPSSLAGWTDAEWMQTVQGALIPGRWQYNLIFCGLIIFFCYFYTAVMFNPVDVAENLKKHGGYIPGIRPGAKTAEYIDYVLTRITTGGALYVAAVCVVPMFVQEEFKVSFYFGGTSLLIVVSVALDTVEQIRSHLITRDYENFTDKTRSTRIRNRQTTTA